MRPSLGCLGKLFLVAALGFLEAVSGAPVLSAVPPGAPAAPAVVVYGANLEVNGVRVPSTATLFPGDIVHLGASSAALQWGRSLVLAEPNTELALEAGGVTLRGGRIQVQTGGAAPLAVFGPFFEVKLAGSATATSLTQIRVQGAQAWVSNVRGFADVAVAGSSSTYRLRAGETATLTEAAGDVAEAQGSASPSAGQVSRLIPQVQIDRSSQQFVAAPLEPVFWNDTLRSGVTGRAHVALNDGSQLNLGSNSSLQILQHDAQAQQTSLDLAIGRLRGKVTKLSRPGAKFEIRTPLGVAGMVGTDFSLDVTQDYVELMVFEGAVRFTIFSNGQSVTVSAGMKVRIERTGLVVGPLSASREEMLTAQNLTDIVNGTAPTASAENNGKKRLVTVAVAISSGAAVLGIGIWRDTQEHLSPSIP